MFGAWTHCPVIGLHESSVHPFMSSQSALVPGTQVPPTQASPTVQPSPSLHGAMFGVCTHPVIGLQVSSVQTSLSLQSIGIPAQTVAAQVSPLVHLLPSSHGAAFGRWVQPV